MNFHVASALKFLEDHFVHAAAGINQCRTDDGQAATIFDVARRTKEFLRSSEGVGIDAAREQLAARWDHGIIGSRQPRNTVKENHHVSTMLDKSLSFFDHHFCNLNVT